MNPEKTKKTKKVSIGGQAVLEGVYMRGANSEATAVRDTQGVIRLETKRKNALSKNAFLRFPLIRGVVSFINSLFGGTAVLMRSAEVYGEGEPSKFEKWLAEKLKINVISVVSTVSLVLGLALAIVLFIFLPQTARKWLEKLFGLESGFSVWAKNFIEGGIKLLIFVLYILIVSLMKDIRRTFMYHGAEHKTITCFERGLPLTVENAKKCPRVHDRCGTTFIVFVLIVSILVFACLESLIGTEINGALRILLKIAILPVVAGLSYELLRALSKTKSAVFFPLKAPGFLLQLLTTREPDDKMLEVAITSFSAVLEMDNDPSIPEKTFEIPEKRSVVLEKVAKTLNDNGITERAESEWIISIVLGIKRDQVNTEDLVSVSDIQRINEVVNERITGKPLWYCIGDTDFYGYRIKVNENVLIPRPETELLAEEAINAVKDFSVDRDVNSVKVLDLCTGSGCIAISVKKQSGANVFASDLSENALSVAKENAADNGAEIDFFCGDLFEPFSEGEDEKFDVIVSNPPYIKTEDIEGLQREVKDFEPLIALDGGKDGLDFYRIIAKAAPNYLKKGGVLLLEVGAGQAQDVKDLLTDFSETEIIKDYENIKRIVKAVK